MIAAQLSSRPTSILCKCCLESEHEAGGNKVSVPVNHAMNYQPIHIILFSHSLDPRSMAWLKKVPTMLMGIDVTHPGPGSVKGAPSIAAVVASYELEFAQYPASMEIQETKKEVLTIPLLFNHRLFKIL